MLISRYAVNGYLGREFDNHLWMKKLLEDQLLDELSRLRVKPKFKTKPWLHQLVCFYIGLCYPQFLFLLDMGLGKSKIILDLITQLQRERKLRRALVTVPRLINLESWKDDIALHSDLEPRVVDVQNIEEKRECLLNPKADLTLIDYQGLHWALSKKNKKGKLHPDDHYIDMAKKIYNFVAMDESHKLGNHQSLWFALLRRLNKEADFTYAMTGTLFGRDIEAIWPQFFLVDHGETFGENLGLFRASFCTAMPNQWGKGEKFAYRPEMDATLNKMLQHRSIRYDEDEVLDLPKRVPIVEQFTMGEEQRGHYLRALDGFINADGDLREITAGWVRMRQISSGYLAWKDEYGDHVLRFKDNPKLRGLERLLDEIGGRSKAVIAYDYTETGSMICDMLKEQHIDHEWLYGGSKDPAACRRRFMDDAKCRVLVMNSEAGGTGNDGLQKVARYLFLYESPSSPVARQQVIKRIHRPGQTMRAFIYDLVMRKSLDAGILQDIKENLDTYDSVVNGKRRLGKGFFLMELPRAT